MENKLKNKVLIIGGPTGSGESTLTFETIKRYPEFQRLVSATSRPIRNGEESGVNYYYFTKAEFLEEIAKGNIVEQSYIENRDTYYGTYKPELEKKLELGNVIANVDQVGVIYFKKKYPAVAIFIKPSSLDVIEGRIRKRNPAMTNEEVAKRLHNAQEEIANEEHLYDYVIINDDGKMEEALKRIEEILKLENYIK